MRDYKKLNIWKNGIQIVKQVYFLAEKLPSREKFGLQSQLSRAAVSIPRNIVEGSSRSSKIEFKRFLEIAMGSLFGVKTQLLICEELHFLVEKETQAIKLPLDQKAKMINSLTRFMH